MLLDFSYSNREKNKLKKKKIIKKKVFCFLFFFFNPEQLVNNTNLQAPSHSSTGRSFTTVSCSAPHTRASMGTLPARPSVRPSVCPGVPHVRMTPLQGGCLGRQGSSGSRSCAKTESSPEEQVLWVSWPAGEYCSKGTERSRYSCQGDRAISPGFPHTRDQVSPPTPIPPHSHRWTSR